MAVPRRRRSTASRTLSDSALADDVRERRLTLGLTQQEVADLAGVSRSSLQALETGQTSVRLSAMLATAKVLGCSVVLITNAEAASRQRVADDRR